MFRFRENFEAGIEAGIEERADGKFGGPNIATKKQQLTQEEVIARLNYEPIIVTLARRENEARDRGEL